MKKRILLLGLVLALLTALAGCFRWETTMRVNRDGTVSMRIMSAYSPELVEKASNAFKQRTEEDTAEELKPTKEPADRNKAPRDIFSKEHIAQWEKRGFSYEWYDEEGFIGVVLTCKDVDIDALPDISKELSDSGVILFFVDSDGFKIDGRHVLIGARPDGETDRLLQSGVPGSMEDLPVYEDGTFGRFTLELPVKPKAHNAPYVSADGKTLTWDLNDLYEADLLDNRNMMLLNNAIYAEFDLPLPPVLLGLLIGLPVLAVLILVWILLRRKRAPLPETDGGGSPLPEEGISPEEGPRPEDEKYVFDIETIFDRHEKPAEAGADLPFSREYEQKTKDEQAPSEEEQA